MDGQLIRVLVTAFAPVPGVSPHASALLGMAAAIRADLEMITLKTEALAHMERTGDARVLRVPTGLGTASEQRMAFGRACVRQVESQPYDIVHVRGAMEGQILAEHRKAHGFRFIYEIATFPDEAEGTDEERRWAEAHAVCAEAADLIIVPTEAAARHLAEGGHAGKVAVVHPGVDVNTYDWWPAGEGASARLLYLGSFAADRDLSTVLSAIKTVQKKRPVEMLIAGEADAERRDRLRRIVSSFELDGVVTVRGEPRPQLIPMIIGAADVCIASAAATPRYQDFGDVPQPLLEHIACRRPVVAAGVPGVAEVLRDDKEVLLYPPSEQDTLAESILALVEQPTLRARLVEAAYDRVRWQFSDGARRRRIAEVYEMLVPGSQLYDSWQEGFERGGTGSLDVASTGVAARLADRATALADGAAIVFGSAADSDAPVARDDTSPGAEIAEVEDLADIPTEIARAKTDVSGRPDTDQTDAPGVGDPDTGPVRAPE